MQKIIYHCCEGKQFLQNDPKIINTVIIRDETWMHHFDSLNKSTATVWKQSDSLPNKKKNPTKQICSKGHDDYFL